MDFSGLLLVQIADPSGSLQAQIPYSLPLRPPDSPNSPFILNFSLSATLLPGTLADSQVFSVLDRAGTVLSPKDWEELRTVGVLQRGRLYEGSFYLYKTDSWLPLRLESVFIDSVLDAYYYKLHAKTPDFVLLRLSASFPTSHCPHPLPPIVPGQDIMVISSPFGLLGPAIYHNSVSKGAISMVLEGNIAVVQARMLPGTAGGTVLSPDFTTVIGLLVPGFGEIGAFALMYPLSRCEMAGNSALHRAIRRVVSVKSRLMSGSGVVCGPDLILTNRHVVGDSTEVTVRLEGKSYAGRVTALGKVLDVAWVRVAGLQWVPLERAAEMRLGESVYAIGYGNLLSDWTALPMVTTGSLSKLIYHESSLIALQSSAYVLDGQSGGALVNSQGQLLALITSTVKVNGQPLRTLGLSIALEALHRPEMWESQEKWLREIFEYQNVDSLPIYRGKL